MESGGSGSSSTWTLASVTATLPVEANRLTVIETGTEVSRNELRSTVPDKLGSSENTPRLPGTPATTHVAPPAETLVRPATLSLVGCK